MRNATTTPRQVGQDGPSALKTPKGSSPRRLPLTKLKVALARLLSRGLRLFFSREQEVTREGIRYALDLTEGIDLSVFLLGGFQRHVTAGNHVKLPEDGVVIDVGANIGVTALTFARMVPRGRVYAFEASPYAYGKIRRNLELNPELARRITLKQAFVEDRSETRPGRQVFSRWPLVVPDGAVLHETHRGMQESVDLIPSVTLDEAVREWKPERLDLLKIDTDGSELDVLRGARATLKEYRPAVIFEVGQYLLDERNIPFEAFTEILDPLHYRLLDLRTGKTVTATNFRSVVPRNYTTDLIALPPA